MARRNFIESPSCRKSDSVFSCFSISDLERGWSEKTLSTNFRSSSWARYSFPLHTKCSSTYFKRPQEGKLWIYRIIFINKTLLFDYIISIKNWKFQINVRYIKFQLWITLSNYGILKLFLGAGLDFGPCCCRYFIKSSFFCSQSARQTFARGFGRFFGSIAFTISCATNEAGTFWTFINDRSSNWFTRY